MQLKTKAFTLIELLVAIAIISIMILGGTQINFNRISEKQELEIFNNKIVALFEEIRNNALLGKGIGASLEVPQQWKLQFGSGGVSSYYSLNNIDWISYNNEIKIEKQIKINNFNCADKNGVIGTPNIEGEDIIISGMNLSLSGSCSSGEKILQFDTVQRNNFKNTLSINTLNGLIEID